MKLFDECIAGVQRLAEAQLFRKLNCSEADCSWPDVGKNQLIFKSDMAYELGGSNLPAVSGMFLTDSRDSVTADEIWLCGKDLSELKEDTPYARIALIRVREDFGGSADVQYQAIRKIDYTRYHLNPKGYMIRISPVSQRENVRISREALQEGLDFAKVGNLFLQAYHTHPAVESVKLLFITEPDFPYSELSGLVERAENITKTLDHLLKKVQMDCNACGLKVICAEVEELYHNEFG